jgi:hypothetical protein
MNCCYYGSAFYIESISDIFDLELSYMGVCPLTCTLYDSDCSTAFSTPSHVWIENSADAPNAWIRVSRSIAAGYNYDVCVGCHNGQVETTMDYTWNVELIGIGIDCSNKLSDGAPVTSTLTFSDATGATTDTVFPNPTYSNLDDVF